jgi:hypothetical protein
MILESGPASFLGVNPALGAVALVPAVVLVAKQYRWRHVGSRSRKYPVECCVLCTNRVGCS